MRSTREYSKLQPVLSVPLLRNSLSLHVGRTICVITVTSIVVVYFVISDHFFLNLDYVFRRTWMQQCINVY